MKPANASNKAGIDDVAESQAAADTASDAEAAFSAEADASDPHAAAAPDYRRMLAQQTVKHWCHWGTAAALIPLPILDTATLAGIQGKMIFDLCEIYGVPFRKEWATAVVGAVAGGSLATVVGSNAGAYLIRMIPVAGTTLSFLTQPAMGYASTYAFGTLFVKHLENGGNLRDFDFEKVKGSYQQAVQKAKGLFGRKAPQAAPAADETQAQPV